MSVLEAGSATISTKARHGGPDLFGNTFFHTVGVTAHVAARAMPALLGVNAPQVEADISEEGKARDLLGIG